MRRIICACMAMAVGLSTGCATGGGGGGGNGNNNDNVNTNGGVELGVDLDIPNEGASHVDTGTQVNYVANPPASGSHWGQTASAGFYETAVDEEQWVHNLEHGYVVILYDCNGTCDQELLAQLESLAETAPPSAVFNFAKIIVTAYEGLPEPAIITAAAWDVQMHLDAFDEDALLAFYGRYLDQGPELAP